MATETVRHTFGDGKYEYVRQPDFKAHVYRHGEEWRDVTGDGLILAMVQRVEELEECLGEMLDQHDNGLVGVSDACAARAKAVMSGEA